MKFNPKYIWNDLDMVRSLIVGVVIGTIFGLVMGFELWRPIVVNCGRPFLIG